MKNNKFLEYNENLQRGTPGFPIQLYLVDEKHHQYIMPLHWHKELEIIKIVSGKLELYINNSLYIGVPGDIFIVNCKFLHRATPKNCIYECVVLDLEYLSKMNSSIYTEYIYPIIAGKLIIDPIFKNDNSKIYNTLNSLFFNFKTNQPFLKLTTTSKLFKILELFYTNNNLSENELFSENSHQSDIIYNLIEWIEDNITEKITLKILADKAGLTPNYLCRIFKAYTGKTPIEYINFIRIQNVCQEIKCSKKSITQIATDNGFNDISYFCKVFKKQNGITAKNLAKQIKK